MIPVGFDLVVFLLEHLMDFDSFVVILENVLFGSLVTGFSREMIDDVNDFVGTV